VTPRTRTIGSPDATRAVDWEQRIDFPRLRRDRLARAKAALEASDLGALLLFDPNNIRYVTSTHIGEWARDKNARFALLPRGGDPILWDFGSAARHHQMFAPWLPPENFRAGVAPMRGAMPVETGIPDRLGERIALLLDAFGIGRPSGVLSSTFASLLGVIVLALAFWGVGEIASRLWEGWDARERQLALQPVPQWRPVRQIEVPLWLCGIGALSLLLFAASGWWLLAAPAAVLVVIAWVVAKRAPRGHVVNPAT